MLFDDYITERTLAVLKLADEVELVQQIAEEHKQTVVDETLQKIFEEHNSANPHSNPAEQCQCVNCIAYRAERQK